MRRRFFWGMVAVAVTTILVGGLTAIVLVSRSVEQSARTEFARQASATAQIVDTELVAGRGRGARLPQILREVALVGGHDYVEAAIVGPNGGVTVLGEGGPLLDLVTDLETLRTPRSFDATVEGDSVTAIAQPFPIGPRGTLVVVIGTRLELIPWREVLVRFGVAIAFAFVLAAALAASLSRFAGTRLAAVQRASRAIAGGDLTARVPVEGSDELADMGRAFNEMAEQLEGARRREREFLMSVGHDLRTPLTTIAGYAEAMQDGRIAGDDLPRVAGVLGGESDRLRRLVEDLMLLSRLETPEFTLRPERVDLAGHLRGVVAAFAPRAQASGVHLAVEIEAVPEVMIDPDRIGQVVGNLIENALRYTPESGTVTVRLGRRGDDVRLEVADTGPGIDPADLPHVFDKWYVAARYRPLRPEGSGLGLSIVRRLVTAMGGRAEAVSTAGHGTTIRVLLPAAARGSGALA